MEEIQGIKKGRDVSKEKEKGKKICSTWRGGGPRREGSQDAGKERTFR